MPNRRLLLAVTGALLLAVAAALPVPADAASKTKRWRMQSPDGRLTATIRFHGADAPLRAVVRRRGQPVLTSTIGLATATRCLPMGFRPESSDRATVFERYRTRAGKRRLHRFLAHKLDLVFAQGGSELRVELRASDDGFAYRTSLTGSARTRVTGECSAYTAPGAQAWLQRFNRAYEATYDPVLLRDAPPGTIGFPALLRTPAGWTLLSESDVGTGQPGTRLEVRPGIPDTLFVARPHDRPGLQLVRTPWRAAVIGSLATIVASDLVDDLAPARRAARLVVGQARPRRVVVVGRRRQPVQPAGPAGLRRLRGADGLGVRARRRGLGPRMDPAARRLRPRAPRPGAALGALGRARAPRAARRGPRAAARLGRRGREARLHGVRRRAADGLVPRWPGRPPIAGCS